MAFIGADVSSSKGYQRGSKIPEISEVSQDITGEYLRRMPEILGFLNYWSPSLQNTLTANTVGSAPVLNALTQQNLQSTGASERAINAGNFQQAMGQQAAQSAQANALNPTIGQTGAALKELLSPNLTGSELSNIERGTNRQFLGQGTFNTPSRMQELQAAMDYGNAGRNRMLQGVNAVAQATPMMQNLNPALNYAPKNFGTDISKVDTDFGSQGTKMLFTNPVEAASQAYISAIGSQTPESKEKSSSTGVSI